ncbi:hypothetical protein M9Y10_026950 [Tritrichomonas musculus]|uniref:Uncharacterized protein n=1 Tax=Tritrichomonas musculus TaxID=1915356 RepID=A0ABR2H6Z7_9EUKA
MIVGNNETSFKLNREDLRSVDYISMTSNGKGTSYIDDIKAVTDQYVEPYFPDYLKNPSDDESKNDPSKKPNKSGLGVGPIIGIVVAIIAVIVIIIVIIVIVQKKKAKQDTSTNEVL